MEKLELSVKVDRDDNQIETERIGKVCDEFATCARNAGVAVPKETR
jgi:hypothetical protein